MEQGRLRQALEHLSAERASRPGVPLARLVDEAALRFDLDAVSSEWLLRSALQSAPGGGSPTREAPGSASSPSPARCARCGGAVQPVPEMPGHLVCGSGHIRVEDGGRP